MNTFSTGSLRIRGASTAPAPGAATAAAANDQDDALARLVKLAPAEVITVYLAGKSAFPGQLPLFGGIMLLVCFLWRWLTTRQAGKDTQFRAIICATITFGLWVYATGGSLFVPAKPTEAQAAFLSVTWTVLIAPLLVKGD